ncbi:MAG TPA: DUF429 domain-containing protein [Methylomirabilota bacterium]|nr:DUF429 domain-containing protein [Methylomirabilota bacterium]
MRVVGVDLAWSTGRTGLCAVEAGRVLDSARVTTDDEIVAWVRGRDAPELLLAVDAPLIVANATGRRPCEGVVSGAYGAQHAGTHPANLGLPAFARGVRGARLARRLALDTAPAALDVPPRRAAIEVYPHAALVSLFGLPRILKYKARRGRTAAARRAAFLALLDRLRELAALHPPLAVTTSPRWAGLESAVRRAARAAELDAVEDELDAYVCAYVGAYHLAWRGRRSLTVGDAARGYIVTPVDEAHAARLRRLGGARGVGVS